MDFQYVHLNKIYHPLEVLLDRLEVGNYQDDLEEYIVQVREIMDYIDTINVNHLKRQQLYEEEMAMSIASMHILRGGKIV